LGDAEEGTTLVRNVVGGDEDRVMGSTFQVMPFFSKVLVELGR
jgi:hypothetical protein